MPPIIRRLWYLIHQRRLQAELSEELAFHRRLKEEALQRDGLAPEAARHAAQRAIGSELRAHDEARAVWIPPLLDGVWNDIKYALRAIRRSPSFVAGVVATLAIGIGAACAVFSLVDAVMLRPLPVPDASRLVRLTTRYATSESQLAFPDTYKAWLSQTALFDAVAAHRLQFMNLTGQAKERLIPVAHVTASFFRIFAAAPARGRVFTADEDHPGGPAVAVLDAGFWARQFGGDPHVIGKKIELNGVPHVVIGVLPAHYETREFNQHPDAWVPLQYDLNRKDGSDYSTVTARLKPGVTLAVTNAKLAAAYAAAHQKTGESAEPHSTWAAESLQDALAGNTRKPLLLLFAAVGLVLLVACANVVNLLLVRADARKRELAIRRAAGAGPARILRHHLLECAILSLVGGVLGLALGELVIRAVLTVYPAANPFNAPGGASSIPAVAQAGTALNLGWHVVAFTLLVCMMAAVAFGLLTLLATSRHEPYRALKHTDGSGGDGVARYRFRAALIVAEIAIALTLVIGAALLIRTSLALRSVQPGFRTDHLLTMRMSVTGTPFQTASGMKRLVDAGHDQLSSFPGVAAVGASCCMPLETVWQLPFVIEGRPSSSLTHAGNLLFSGFGGWAFVSPGYFKAMGIPLLLGRTFNAADAAGAPGTVIINETMAKRFWPQGDALGHEITIGRGMGPQFANDPVRRIVGIIGDVRNTALGRSPRPTMYVPMAQLPNELLRRQLRLLPLVWFVRTDVTPYSLTVSVSAALRRASGGLPVTRIRSMQDVVHESTARTRFDMLLMTLFGAVALLLAVVGVYGLIAYTVEQRTREVGLRIALGASVARVRNMVIRQGMKLAAAGIVVGVAGALALSRVLAGLLFGVTARDPLVFFAVPLIVLFAAFVATLVPARRASRVDPLVALRSD